MNSSDINSLGLISNIIGTLIVWYFVAEITLASVFVPGLPENYRRWIFYSCVAPP
jgi:hypothetical protein